MWIIDCYLATEKRGNAHTCDHDKEGHNESLVTAPVKAAIPSLIVSESRSFFAWGDELCFNFAAAATLRQRI